MVKKDDYNSDNREFNISLIASLFTVFLVTMIEIIVDILNAYVGGITPFLTKVVIAGVMAVMVGQFVGITTITN